MPTLVAVSKLMPVETLMLAYNENQRHFGENYVQEICEKAPTMPDDIKWHFIGSLQSNKAKMLVNNVKGLYMVESVDSQKLATQLDKACEAAKRDALQVLVQVNTSQEESKGGCEDHQVADVARHILEKCKNLKFLGLMTIGNPPSRPIARLLEHSAPSCSVAIAIPLAFWVSFGLEHQIISGCVAIHMALCEMSAVLSRTTD
jgi:pyridoxal phosphate enzyme (YggS family)